MSEAAKTKLEDFKPVPLRFPVTFQGEEFKQISFKRRPTVQDNLRGSLSRKQGVTEEQIEVNQVADLCDVDPELLSLLDLGDWLKIQEKYTAFFSRA